MSFSSQSFYKYTDTINNIRGYLKPISLPHDPKTDKQFVISAKYANKPGLLAYDLYGSARYNWVFAYYNRDIISDSLVDMVEGLTITIPSADRVKTI